MGPELTQWLNERKRDPELKAWVGDVLWDLCQEDTSLGSDLDRLREGEQRCFRLLTEAMQADLPAGAKERRLNVPSQIADDPYFTTPYYAGAQSDDVAAVYRDRYNWLIDPRPNIDGDYWLLNAHVDTVPPHIPPSRIDAEHMAGRGTADDKNGLVAMAVVQRLLREWHDETGIEPNWPVRYLVSIDEEMGGNGSLGAARHLNLSSAHIVVAEPSSLLPYPANRGAVWFAAKLNLLNERDLPYRYGIFAFIADALMAAGRTLRNESEHPLFNAAKDAQTCFGMLGPFGLHPSSACDEVHLRWLLAPDTDEALQHRLDEAGHIVRSRMASAMAQGRLIHDTHDPELSLTRVGEHSAIEVRVTAIGGHMGSHERDSDALAKAAEIILGMMEAGYGVPEWPDSLSQITLEGGQGFLPDRSLEDLQQRMTHAFNEGLVRACEYFELDAQAMEASMTYDKLHNAAFCSHDDAPGGQRLARAIADLNQGELPVLKGWKASCDARIFARQCPDVTTFGPGALEVAHSTRESIALQDILDMAAAFVHAVMQDAEAQA